MNFLRSFCCRKPKCANETDFTRWTTVSLAAGGAVTKGKQHVGAVSNNLGVIGVEDLDNLINPNKDFNLRTMVRRASGSQLFVGMYGPAANLGVAAPFFAIQASFTNVSLTWGTGSLSFDEAIASASTDAVEYVVRKSGTRVTVYANGNKLGTFSIDRAFPKSKLYPLFYVGATGLSPVAGDLYSYCVKQKG